MKFSMLWHNSCLFFILSLIQVDSSKLLNARMILDVAHIRTSQRDASKFDFRIPLAGGLAGAFSTAVLFPIDTYKTMRQTDSTISSFSVAIQRLKNKGLLSIYSGFLPSVFGSLTSSAIYFGTYEYAKSIITQVSSNHLSRQVINALAAMSGNILSSFIFVPKDALKQQLQYLRTQSITSTASQITLFQLISDIYMKKGIIGFYPSYMTTLLRNIPSAIIRFTLYEEFKYYSNKLILASKNDTSSRSSSTSIEYDNNIVNTHNLNKYYLYMISGALASSLSSGLTTPLDVLKTRYATGMINPSTTPIVNAIRSIIQKEGVRALYRGIQARMIWSSLFGGIGFYTFEKCKVYLGVTPKQYEPSL